MDERIPCPLCRHGNLPENRFCGHCGVLMTSRGQLTPRPEANPTAAIRSLPTKLGPVGKTLAVGVAVLAAEAGLSWLQRRIGTEERSLPAVRDAGSASGGYLVGQSLEEVLVQTWEGPHSRVLARREVRSFVATTGPTGRRR
jgi:hypothetical protein